MSDRKEEEEGSGTEKVNVSAEEEEATSLTDTENDSDGMGEEEEEEEEEEAERSLDSDGDSHTGSSFSDSSYSSTSSRSAVVEEERTFRKLVRLRDAVSDSQSFDDEDLRHIDRVVAAYAPKAARARAAYDKQRRYADELQWMRARLHERAKLLDESGIDFRATEFASLARFFMVKQTKLSACLEGVAAQGALSE